MTNEMSIKTSLALLKDTYRTRRISTIQTLEWARATYRLSRAIEIAGRLSDTKFLRKEGLTQTQVAQVRLFAKRLSDIQTLEGLLEWMLQYSQRCGGSDIRPGGPMRQLSRIDVIYELACTGKPLECPRWEGAFWQSVGHWGSDGQCHYDIEGPAL